MHSVTWSLACDPGPHPHATKATKVWPRKSLFSPPLSRCGKRCKLLWSRWHVLAAASPSGTKGLAMQGGTPQPHRNRSWCIWRPLEDGSMRAWRGAISNFAWCCWSRRVSRPKAGSLETPQVGNSAGCGVSLSPFLPSLCQSGLRCDCGKGGSIWQERWVGGLNCEPHRSTGRGLGRPVKPKMGFLEKEGFVGANSNGRRGFVTSSSVSLPCSEKGL